MHLRKRASSADSNRQDSMTGSGGASLLFCVSPIMFDCCGGLLFDTPSGITVPAILRLPSHCSMRAHITTSEWYTAASAAFGFNEVVAANIFDTFYVLSQTSADSRLEEAKIVLSKLSKHGGDSEAQPTYASLSPQRTISLPGLMLFLIVQVFLEKQSRTLPGDYNADQCAAFVKQYLHEIITALTVTKAGRVTQTDLHELRILFREFCNGVESPFGTNLTFLWPRGEQTVDCAVISQFARQRVVSSNEIKSALSGSVMHRNLLSGVHVIQNGPSLRIHSFAMVQRCQQATFYLLSPLPNTILAGLANCVVVCGPVSGLLSIVSCENCQIVAPCAGVAITNSKNIELYVCTNTPPIISPNNFSKRDEDTGSLAVDPNIKIGPFNTFYSSLEEHLSTARVNPQLNLFAEGVNPEMLIPPEGLNGSGGFTAITVPAAPPTTNTVTTRTNPCWMPAAYVQAMTARVENFQETSKTLQDAYKKLEDAGRRDLADNLRNKVHLAFMDWLVEVGQAKNILHVLHQNQSA